MTCIVAENSRVRAQCIKQDIGGEKRAAVQANDAKRRGLPERVQGRLKFDLIGQSGRRNQHPRHVEQNEQSAISLGAGLLASIAHDLDGGRDGDR